MKQRKGPFFTLMLDAAWRAEYTWFDDNYKFNFRDWLIQMGSGLHYCIFDLENNRSFDKNAIKQA
jgi:hypothetical protein